MPAVPGRLEHAHRGLNAPLALPDPPQHERYPCQVLGRPGLALRIVQLAVQLQGSGSRCLGFGDGAAEQPDHPQHPKRLRQLCGRPHPLQRPAGSFGQTLGPLEATPTSLKVGPQQVHPRLGHRVGVGQRTGLVEVGPGLLDRPPLQAGACPAEQVGHPTIGLFVAENLHRPAEQPVGQQPVGTGLGPFGGILGPGERRFVQLRVDLVGPQQAALQ